MDELDYGLPPQEAAYDYGDESIVHLEDMEHIRLRPGMYIGKLGDGSSHDDGIYVLIKEVIDNAIDEFSSGYGKKINVKINFGEKRVSIRDYGRGIPLGKMIEAVSKLNTGAKYDSKVFQKSVGLNGVGTKAVNALSSWFKVQSVRDGKTRIAEFGEGRLTSDSGIVECGNEENGTLVEFVPDATLFGNYHFIGEYVEKRVWNYCYLNRGLTIYYNDKRYYSKNGLLDLLENKVALAVPEGNPAGIESYDDWADRLGARELFMAMGNEDVPVGQYTQKILAYYGLSEEELAAAGCITYGSNVKEVTTQVSEATVDCGIIYQTDAFSAQLQVVDTATAEMCGQVIYPAAVMNVSKNPEAAQAYLDYLSGPEATAVFEGVGFSAMS